MVLIPCISETECFEGLPRTARMARAAGKRAVVIPNFIYPSGQAEKEVIRSVASAHELESSSVALHEYQVHRDRNLQGKTAQELQPASKAAAELGALWTRFWA